MLYIRQQASNKQAGRLPLFHKAKGDEMKKRKSKLNGLKILAKASWNAKQTRLKNDLAIKQIKGYNWRNEFINLLKDGVKTASEPTAKELRQIIKDLKNKP